MTVTQSSMNGSPALSVTWTGPTGSGISYIVKYSTTNQASPPPREKTTSTSPVTLTEGIQQGTTYYVWVAAIRNGLQGSYSSRRSATSFSGKVSLLLSDNKTGEFREAKIHVIASFITKHVHRK